MGGRLRHTVLWKVWRRLRKVLLSMRISRARNVPLSTRLELAARIAPITWRTLFVRPGPAHTDPQIYTFIDAALARPDVPGVIVEAGAYKGHGTAKLSHVAALQGRRLVVFDSFEGLPDNDEPHDQSILGHSIEGWFQAGNYAGSLREVRANVAKYGSPDVVEFVPGWFDDSMAGFDRPIAGAYIDVDLASSTRTCLDFLWPLVSAGGVMVSQDGDFPLVIEEIRSWLGEGNRQVEEVVGLGTSKMVMLVKAR